MSPIEKLKKSSHQTKREKSPNSHKTKNSAPASSPTQKRRPPGYREFSGSCGVKIPVGLNVEIAVPRPLMTSAGAEGGVRGGGGGGVVGQKGSKISCRILIWFHKGKKRGPEGRQNFYPQSLIVQKREG